MEIHPRMKTDHRDMRVCQIQVIVPQGPCQMSPNVLPEVEVSESFRNLFVPGQIRNINGVDIELHQQK